ncbi:MAG TPA: adenylate/guanylate cyclase domain-containing protein [Stellaceae bacterium]|nr:adenylate/guanylate cyclase domain-containing protein [Stellaceae bacterium]
MIQRARLWSGLVMLAYVVTHFLNHSLGLVSVRVMDVVLRGVYHVWASPPGTLLLYGAFATHYSLALRALWQRRALRMPLAEAMQLVLGFSIPFLLAEHVISTRVGDSLFNADYGYYSSVLLTFFVASPWRGVLQLTVLVVAWVHAMIGLRFWLRLKPWYPRWQWALFAAALLLPTLAILGFAEGGREVAGLAQSPAWVARNAAEHPRAAPADLAFLTDLVLGTRGFFAAALLAVLLARSVRRQLQRRRGLIRLAYGSGRVVEIVPGLSVLEASRLAGIPHASVCGGRGRCSTCRVRIVGDPVGIPLPSLEERRVLERVGAAPDVRLACQLRPRGAVSVTPLLPAMAQPRDGFARPAYLHGSEREIAILFADLRAFTRLAERKLPYDLVFLLNRYFAAMGHAIEEAGGHIDKFIGDGVMALFGLDRGVDVGCREALAAARAMSLRLQQLNEALAHDLERPLRIGIGIHVGHAIVGEMGYGRAVSLTAVGDAVNTASRLEGVARDNGAELVVSEAVLTHAGIALDESPAQELEIRGRVERLTLRILASARTLPAPSVRGARRPPSGAALSASDPA